MDDLCNRCLVSLSTATIIRAKYVLNDMSYVNVCTAPTDPRRVKEWAEEQGQLSGGSVIFEIDAGYDMILPVSTWAGDPVCPNHLVECREREWGHYERGSKAYPRR